MRAVIYSRVSTDAQEKDGTSLDTQESACLEYAQRSGWEVVAQVRDSASGASLDRPGIEHVRQMMRSGDTDLVLSYAVDRLSRNQNQIGLLLDEADRYSVRLEFVTERFEDTSIGRFILSTRTFVAEVEREKILERTTRGKAERARSGRIPQATGKGFYGYSYDRQTGKRTVIASQAEIVLRIYGQFVAGLSLSGVARRLNDDLVPAFSGGRWHPLTVRRMLLNETYTGRTVYRRTKVEGFRDPSTGKKRRKVAERDPSAWIEVPDATPMIVSPELFARAQAILASPERRHRGRPSQTYRLRGRARCIKCDTPMTGQALGGGRWVYYRCRNSFASNAVVKCDARYIRKDDLEESVLTQLITVLTDPERLAEEARRFFGEDGQHSVLEDLTQAIRRVEEKQKRLAHMFVEGTMPEEILHTEAEQLRTQREELERKALNARRGASPSHETVVAQLPLIAEHIRLWAQTAEGEDFDLLLRALDVHVFASRERAVIEASVPILDSVQKQNLVTTGRTSA